MPRKSACDVSSTAGNCARASLREPRRRGLIGTVGQHMAMRNKRNRRDRRDGAELDRVETHEPPPLTSEPIAGYRVLRRIAHGSRVDVLLATPVHRAESMTPVVLRIYEAEADHASIAAEIEVMEAQPCSAVPRLLDVATTADGRTCVAVERIARGSLATILAERSLALGEVVTILATMLQAQRALVDAGLFQARMSPADVLFDDDGRPRLIGLGALRTVPSSGVERTNAMRSAQAAFGALVQQVGAASSTRVCAPLFDALASAHSDEPFDDTVERAVFTIAAPTAIALQGGASREKRAPTAVQTARGSQPQAAARKFIAASSHEPDRGSPVEDAPETEHLESLAQVPGRFAEWLDGLGVWKVRTLIVERFRGRRRALIFGALIGAGVLVAVLTFVPSESHATRGAASAASDESADLSTADHDSTVIAANADVDSGRDDQTPQHADAVEYDDAKLVESARELLALRAQCFEELDEMCLRSVAQEGSPVADTDRDELGRVKNGAPLTVDLDPSQITVAGTMGEVVLLEVARVGSTSSDSEPASLLMMWNEAGWRLRAIFG